MASVEFLDRGRAALLHAAGLIAKADDPPIGGSTLCLLLHPLDQIGNVLHTKEIGVNEVLPEIDHVAMGVDESGEQCLAGQVDGLRFRADVLLCVGCWSDEENLSVLHGQTLGIVSRVPAHRENVAAGVENVGDLGGCWRRE